MPSPQLNSNRRHFVKSASLTALGMASGPFMHQKSLTAGGSHDWQRQAGDSGLSFPEHFIWGTATAAYQVEGAAAAEGRGPSIWDTFSHIQGKIKNNDNGDIACDFYHKYEEDIQLIKNLHASAYRFSISWSRIFPDGTGRPNQEGVDFYNRLVDNLLSNDIKPFPTLFHWDLPQALQDRYKGWQSRETAQAFADYAAYISKILADRINNFFTLNEVWTFIELGYGIGIHAPGLQLPANSLNQARHHAVLAHGMAVQAIRANGTSETKVGIAENIKVAVPVFETAEHIAAARKATREINAGYLTVVMEGAYTDRFLEMHGADAPRFTAEDLKTISTPADFCGINIYNPECYVAAAPNETGYEKIPFAKSHPTSTSFWELLAPETIYWGAKHLQDLWHVPEIYITENGYSSTDELSEDGQITDTDRIMFLRGYLSQLQRATSQGVPVKGYFYWSLMDNFEWAAGYGIRFGLFYMDYKTLKRIPKLSSGYFKAMAMHNAVL